MPANPGELSGLDLRPWKDELAEQIEQYRDLASPIERAANPDPDEVADMLIARSPWLTTEIDQVRRRLRLARRVRQAHFCLPPLLLKGGPGVGKTAFASAIAKAAGVPCHIFQAGAAFEASSFSGTPPTFHAATPSFAIREMRLSRIGNPVIVIDEIDKIAWENVRLGRIADALLPLLELGTASNWVDPCLQAPCDLSAVSWILTVNDASRLPQPLLSRLHILA